MNIKRNKIIEGIVRNRTLRTRLQNGDNIIMFSLRWEMSTIERPVEQNL